jgi:hypothetical protein
MDSVEMPRPEIKPLGGSGDFTHMSLGILLDAGGCDEN